MGCGEGTYWSRRPKGQWLGRGSEQLAVVGWWQRQQAGSHGRPCGRRFARLTFWGPELSRAPALCQRTPRPSRVRPQHPPMPPILTPQNLGHAVLESVEHGAYPDSEAVASAQLPAAALPSLLQGIARAQNEVKVAGPRCPRSHTGANHPNRPRSAP